MLVQNDTISEEKCLILVSNIRTCWF